MHGGQCAGCTKRPSHHTDHWIQFDGAPHCSITEVVGSVSGLPRGRPVDERKPLQKRQFGLVRGLPKQAFSWSIGQSEAVVEPALHHRQ